MSSIEKGIHISSLKLTLQNKKNFLSIPLALVLAPLTISCSGQEFNPGLCYDGQVTELASNISDDQVSQFLSECRDGDYVLNKSDLDLYIYFIEISLQNKDGESVTTRMYLSQQDIENESLMTLIDLTKDGYTNDKRFENSFYLLRGANSNNEYAINSSGILIQNKNQDSKNI